MAKFNSITARQAGRKSKRGQSKVSATTREFIFTTILDNRDRFNHFLNQLSPQDFVNTYLKLLPFILGKRNNQFFEVGELSLNQTQELILEMIDEN